jgi:hypothetical protein
MSEPGFGEIKGFGGKLKIKKEGNEKKRRDVQ